MIRAALFAARCRCRCSSRGRKPWRERPRRARSQWSCARHEWVAHAMAAAVHRNVSPGLQRAGAPRRLGWMSAAEASGNPGESEQQCTPSQGQEIHIVLSTLTTVIHPEDFVHLHLGSMFLDHVKSYSRTISVMRRMTTAITSSMLALCSAACKALRFASTAHARGLRALTLPPRSRIKGDYVMAGRVNTERSTKSGA